MRTWGVVLAWAGGAVIGMGCETPKRHKMGRALVTVTAEGPTAADCGGCHVHQYREWRGSPHARAWTDPVFVRQTDGHRFAACLPCHAPVSALGEGPVELRSRSRDEGVTCIVCHLKEGRLAGPVPNTALIRPHPVAVEAPIYRQSRLCGVCHEGTYQQWQAAESPKKTCQQCHMREVRRRVTKGTDPISKLLAGMEQVVVQREHGFAVCGPSQTKIVDVKLAPSEAKQREVAAVLEVVNLLPHALPSGDFGIRRVVVQARFLDGQGGELSRQTTKLIPQLGTAIPPGGRGRYRLGIPAGAERVEVDIYRERGKGQSRCRLWQGGIALP